MKKQIGFSFLTIIMTVSLLGCSIGKKEPTETESVKLTTQEAVTSESTAAEETPKNNTDITAKTVKKYMDKIDDDSFTEEILSAKEKELTIEVRQYKEENMYFVVYTPKDSWYSVLYRIRMEDGAIDGLDYVATSAVEYFSFDIISLSEGYFVAVYCANNTYNGNLILIDVNSLYRRSNGDDPTFEFLAIDNHYEELPCSGSDYKLSKVFKDGILNVEYNDMDGDKTSDVLLTGTWQTYQSTDESDDYILVSEEEVSQLYLYDEKERKFTLQSSEDLSEKVALTWNDMMVNNHELLNESPYPLITKQELMMYHTDEIPSELTKKSESGGYWNYIGYDGITYVFTGEKEAADTDTLQYVVLSDESYSLVNGIQVGMSEEDLSKTSLDFVKYKKKQVGEGKSLSTLFLTDKNGLINTLVDDYDSIYYVSGEVESLEQTNESELSYTEIGLAVVVKDGKVICVATDQPNA